MQIQEVLQVQPIASSTSGYDGGIKSIRDTSGLTGGIRGYVNCVNYSFTIAGKEVKAFEWNNLSVLHNYADEGENCAGYIQANKFGKGPTWAGCAEACSLDENDDTPLVTYELDSWVSGKEHNNRYTLDIVVGDSKVMRQKESTGVAEATAGIRIGNNPSAPWAKFKTGIILGKAIDQGIDASEMQGKVVLKLNSNQVIMLGDTELSSKGVSPNKTLSYISIALSIAAIALVILL